MLQVLALCCRFWLGGFPTGAPRIGVSGPLADSEPASEWRLEQHPAKSVCLVHSLAVATLTKF